jgi:hypothetical protein
MKTVQPNKAGFLAGNEGDIREILTSLEGLLHTMAKGPAETRRGPIKLLIEYQFLTKPRFR